VTVQRPDPARDTEALREATARLTGAAAALNAEDLAGPSRLPGWTRGHVLAHLSRNAEALTNLLTWARTGEETPMYASAEAREAAIEAGAGRPPAEQLKDLRDSAERFAAAWAELPPAAWAAQVTVRSGRVIAAAEIPWLRLVEVLLHHVDLDTGYRCADLPADFAARELAYLLDRLTGHEGVAAVELHDTGSGRTWEIGAATEPEVKVGGSTHDLLAWVSGRGGGEGLAVAPAGAALPVLPPLG
jgi:maleylpyruvate isomerase